MIFIVVKFVLTIFNVMLPIPGGAITPFLVLGAALGRLYGLLITTKFQTAIIAAGYLNSSLLFHFIFSFLFLYYYYYHFSFFFFLVQFLFITILKCGEDMQ